MESPKTNQKKHSQADQETHDLARLSDEELLHQLANSPCANRDISLSQSLEEYLQTIKVNRESPIH